MELIQIGANALKVTLTKEDMAYYAIEFERLDYENAETRRAIWSILDEAKRTIGFEAARDRLYIQAFRDKDGGCELFVRRADPEKSPSSRAALFRFAELRFLLTACAHLQNCGYTDESRAFAGDDGAWYLMLAEKGDTGRFFYLAELGTALPYSEAFLAEHTSPLCEGAVATLSALR